MTMTSASLNGRAQTGGVTDEDIDPAAKPHDERSPPSTRLRSLPSTTPGRRARRNVARFCDARACTPRTSRSGGSRPRLVPVRAWPASRTSADRRRRSSWIGCAVRTSVSPRSSRGRRRRWRSREKCTRSWSSSPRARTPIRGRSRDRRTPPRARGSDVDEASVRAVGRAPVDGAASSPATRLRASSTAAGAAEQAVRA